MTSRDRVTRTLKHMEVDRFPRHLWTLPSIGMFRKDELDELLDRFPQDIGAPIYVYGKCRRSIGDQYQVGEYTDAWGCVWKVAEPGVIGEVKEYPISDWSVLDTYDPPWELLDEADLSLVNTSCSDSELFMPAGTETRPFERMQFLRGTENLFMDIAYGDKEVYTLRDKLHEFFCREMEMWSQTDGDGIGFMDDWGTQNSMLISPDLWREFYKPLYKDYCDSIHSKD